MYPLVWLLESNIPSNGIRNQVFSKLNGHIPQPSSVNLESATDPRGLVASKSQGKLIKALVPRVSHRFVTQFFSRRGLDADYLITDSRVAMDRGFEAPFQRAGDKDLLATAGFTR